LIQGHAQSSYTGCKVAATPDLHGGAFFTPEPCGTLPGMARKRTYIRDWREKRGYTLDDMVGRMEILGVNITGASLSRIERGIQPYNQDTLEAIAEALNVTVAQLAEHNPNLPPAKIIDFLQHLNADEVEQADAVLRAMFNKRG
jgi:transcriptional regulator with XRE-family HTH domain